MDQEVDCKLDEVFLQVMLAYEGTMDLVENLLAEVMVVEELFKDVCSSHLKFDN